MATRTKKNPLCSCGTRHRTKTTRNKCVASRRRSRRDVAAPATVAGSRTRRRVSRTKKSKRRVSRARPRSRRDFGLLPLTLVAGSRTRPKKRPARKAKRRSAARDKGWWKESKRHAKASRKGWRAKSGSKGKSRARRPARRK